jgi:hypothetical protein
MRACKRPFGQRYKARGVGPLLSWQTRHERSELLSGLPQVASGFPGQGGPSKIRFHIAGDEGIDFGQPLGRGKSPPVTPRKRGRTVLPPKLAEFRDWTVSLRRRSLGWCRLLELGPLTPHADA